MKRNLSVAILGTRGVPAVYGGFETFAAEISVRLATRGHAVTVYCRSSLYKNEPELWNGVRRVELPAVRHKYFETVSHALLSSTHASAQGYDAVVLCNAANAFVLPLLRAARIPVAVNVDGIERRRRKWNAIGKFVHLAGEVMTSSLADVIIADAEVIATHYRKELEAKTVVIPYGSQFADEPDSDVLDRLGLRPRGYVLYVSRFEPENNALEVVDSYRDVRTNVPLVMVGDAPYARHYIEEVRRRSDSRVLLPGALYGRDYRTLQRHALVYIQATEVGGTHPAMIEAMASGGAVLANDTSENREVGAEAVQFFSLGGGEGSLVEKLQRSLDDPPALDVYRTKARSRARSLYDWDTITDQYERLFLQLSR